MRHAALVPLFLIALAAAGCSQPARPVAPGSTAVEHAYAATVAGTLAGTAVLLTHGDLHSSTVTGDLVVPGPIHFTLTATAGHDTTTFAVAGGGSLVTWPASGGGLNGHFVRDTIDVALAARSVSIGAFAETAVHAYPYTSTGAGRGGGVLWLATTDDDYVEVNGDQVLGGLQLQVSGENWAGGVMGWQTDRMWATHDVDITDGSTYLIEAADVLAFRASGRTTDSLRVLYRPAGLAWDGTVLWALHPKLPRLLRVGVGGAPISIDIPDARLLTWYAGKFWTVAWTIRRLCALDASGHLVAIYPLTADTTPTPLALTTDGTKFEYVDGVVGTTWTHVLRLP